VVEVIWEGEGAIRLFSGDVTAADLDLSAKLIQDDSRFPALKYVIHDFKRCHSIDVDSSTRDKIVARAAVATMSMKRFASAFVGTLPELQELVRYFKVVQVYDGEFDLFASVPEARAFIARVNGAANH